MKHTANPPPPPPPPQKKKKKKKKQKKKKCTFGSVLLRVHLEYVRDDGVDLDVADQPREEYLLDDVTLQRP